MPDDKTKTGKIDRDRINVNEDYSCAIGRRNSGSRQSA
jgi:hypothetical protein